MATRDIVVMGASMGGVDAVRRVLAGLPRDLPATVLVVQHISPASTGGLAATFGRATELPTAEARDGALVGRGRVYVAPPDHHLLLKEDRLRVVRGPRENRARPALDPLFRSAAATAGPRVIGVVLSGLQDDGSAGLAAIKRCGGVAVVQDPDDAAFPEMPRSALRATEVDHCPPLDELPELLARLVLEPAAAAGPAPRDVVLEAEIAERVMSGPAVDDELGHPVPVSCPGCGGPLWRIEDPAVQRYRCHVGHAYTAASLLAEQAEEVEKALWVAMRTLEERASLLGGFIDDERGRGRTALTPGLEARAEEARSHAAALRRLILSGERAVPDGPDTLDPDPSRAPGP